MDMLLRKTTTAELNGMFERHKDKSPAPYLTDPEAIGRARKLARKNGIWDDISRNLDPTKDIPAIKRSAYRNYRRVGDRHLHQSKEAYRHRELALAAMALWLGHPKANVDYLQDILWAYCDDWTWVMAAHEGCAIDLGSAGLAATFAEILHVLGDRLEDEVKQRVSAEIERRIFQNLRNGVDWWKTGRMNWNHVCNGEVIRTALYQIRDTRLLAHTVHSAIQNMTYAIDGFADDGGCLEGPGYWVYGFGHYLYVAHALYLKTGGELNIMTGDKIERICRYPLAANISGPLCSTFADAHHGHIPARVAMVINEFHKMPELCELCSRHPDRTLRLSGMHELALYRGVKATGKPDHRDYLLPDMGQVKLRGEPGPNQMTVLALAGNNGVPHNHNDIGSFIVHRRGKLLLTDPGAPAYTRKTFSPQRYEIIFCNSLGHSVPLINGTQQPAGQQYHGTLQVENLNVKGQKKAVIDMTHAYPEGTVKRLVRTFILDAEASRLTLEDAYAFDQAPRSLEEAFITFEEVKLSRGGKSVQIGPKDNRLTLSAPDTAGKFSIKRLVEESKEGSTGEVITRISFVPRKLEKEMRLRFGMT
jgi:hypothetical protein